MEDGPAIPIRYLPGQRFPVSLFRLGAKNEGARQAIMPITLKVARAELPRVRRRTSHPRPHAKATVRSRNRR